MPPAASRTFAPPAPERATRTHGFANHAARSAHVVPAAVIADAHVVGYFADQRLIRGGPLPRCRTGEGRSGEAAAQNEYANGSSDFHGDLHCLWSSVNVPPRHAFRQVFIVIHNHELLRAGKTANQRASAVTKVMEHQRFVQPTRTWRNGVRPGGSDTCSGVAAEPYASMNRRRQPCILLTTPTPDCFDYSA